MKITVNYSTLPKIIMDLGTGMLGFSFGQAKKRDAAIALLVSRVE